MEEQLAQLAQRERESVTTTGLDGLTPALIMEKGRVHEEQGKAKLLVSDAFWFFAKSPSYNFYVRVPDKVLLHPTLKPISFYSFLYLN